jgi:HAD superfamily hydrolase (TIGR01509 family)
MNQSVIFDMDGLLVDSEPLWWQAGVEVLRTVGVKLNDSHSRETVGLRTDVALKHWFSLFPWTGKSLQQVKREIEARVIELIAEHAQPMPGALETIHLFAEQKIPMGLCSSSPHSVIAAALKRLNLESCFRVVYSGEDEPMGKPHPGAYLNCAGRLGAAPHRCLVFEDSIYGAIAAKAAGMTVIAVPGDAAQTALFDFCDLTLGSLTEFDAALLDRLLQPLAAVD